MQVRLILLTFPNQTQPTPPNLSLRGYELRYELRTHSTNEFVVKMH